MGFESICRTCAASSCLCYAYAYTRARACLIFSLRVRSKQQYGLIIMMRRRRRLSTAAAFAPCNFGSRIARAPSRAPLRIPWEASTGETRTVPPSCMCGAALCGARFHMRSPGPETTRTDGTHRHAFPTASAASQPHGAFAALARTRDSPTPLAARLCFALCCRSVHLAPLRVCGCPAHVFSLPQSASLSALCCAFTVVGPVFSSASSSIGFIVQRLARKTLTLETAVRIRVEPLFFVRPATTSHPRRKTDRHAEAVMGARGGTRRLARDRRGEKQR